MRRLVFAWDGRRWDRSIGPGDPLLVGSGESADLRLPVPGVSQRHLLAVLVAGGDVELCDLGSKNGLVQGGRRHRRLRLGEGEGARVGRAEVRVEEIDTAETSLAVALSPKAKEEPRSSVGTASLAADSGRSLGLTVATLRALAARSGEELAAHPDEWLGDLRRVVSAGAAALLREEPPAGGALLHATGSWDRDGWEEAALRDDPRSLKESRSGWTLAVRLRSDSERVVEEAREVLRFVLERLPPGDSATGGSEDGGSRPVRDGRPSKVRILGASAALGRCLEAAEAAAEGRLEVLLQGETGVGKELFARFIHERGATGGEPFCAVNCAAIPGELLEAELFGVAKGVATGVEPRQGRFLAAGEGTVLLDEVGELAPRLQPKLLRALQQREVLPLGGDAPRPLRARVVAATNRDLAGEVEAGRFRADLFYRLSGFPITIPPLRERVEDIPELATLFLRRSAERYDRRVRGISRPALRLLMEYRWPGNVRQLERTIERAVLLSPHGGALERELFVGILQREPRLEAEGESEGGGREPSAAEPTERASDHGGETLAEQLEPVERRAIAEALAATGGNKSAAARRLGVSRQGRR